MTSQFEEKFKVQSQNNFELRDRILVNELTHEQLRERTDQYYRDVQSEMIGANGTF